MELIPEEATSEGMLDEADCDEKWALGATTADETAVQSDARIGDYRCDSRDCQAWKTDVVFVSLWRGCRFFAMERGNRRREETRNQDP